MKNYAIVEKIEDNCIIVSTVRKGACGDNCAMCNGCDRKKVLTKAFCDFKVKTGDCVLIESNSISVLAAFSVVFIVPVVLPLFLYLILQSLGQLISVVGITVGVLISCLLIYYISRSDLFLNKITPKIISIVNKF